MNIARSNLRAYIKTMHPCWLIHCTKTSTLVEITPDVYIFKYVTYSGVSGMPAFAFVCDNLDPQALWNPL